MNSWQTIETAPKDGTPVLLWARNLLHVGDCVVARYISLDRQQPSIKSWHVNDGKFGPYALRGPSPTHWQPQPEPPSPEADE